MIENGKRYLVSTDNWFRAPDGENYCAAWGRCHIDTIEKVLGFTPIRPSTNWYMTVGAKGREIIIAGCQIHYAIRCEEKPENTREHEFYKDKDTGVDWKVSKIYYAE
jgi:hypothetical protein